MSANQLSLVCNLLHIEGGFCEWVTLANVPNEAHLHGRTLGELGG